MVVHTCSPSIWTVEAGGLKVQSQCWLEVSLGVMMIY